MPEIDSRDRVLEKLQDFDNRLDGALDAAIKIVSLKDDAAKFVSAIHKTRKDSTELSIQLQQIQGEWGQLRGDIRKILERSNQEMADIERRFKEAKKELAQSNEEARSDHRAFVEESGVHAKSALKSAEQSGRLLASAEQNLQGKISARLNEIELLMNQQLEGIRDDLKTQVERINQHLDDQLKSFKEEVNAELLLHKKGVEEEIVKFLSKQNLLIRNLTQQIDGIQRANQTVALDLQTMAQKMSKQEATIVSMPQEMSKQKETMESMKGDFLANSTQLGQVITRLKGNMWVKGSLKGL